MGVRKSVIRMSIPERENFLYALLTMKTTIANPAEPNPARRISVYDRFVATHLYVISMRYQGGALIDRGHNGPAFGPWHRELLLRFERALQAALLVSPGPPHPGV